MNRKILYWIFASIVTAGILFRILELDSRSLEYDEIWTMTHYFKCTFSEIFTNLATPNNHPLHTLCAKVFCDIFGNDFWTLRMPALLSGIILLSTALWAAVKNFRSKYAKIAFVALTAFSPYLVHYSNTARGYSMQAFFIFAMILFIFSYARKASIGKAAGVFLCAASALFTIYSGLIFVCAAGGAYLLSFCNWRNWRNELKKNLFLFAAGVDFIIIAALWLGLNREKIAEAQQFGIPITSALQFFRNAGHIIYDLGLILPMIILAVAFVLKPKAKTIRFGLSFAILTILSILATKCGPERVYVPMITVIIFCMARGIEIIGARFCKIKYMELIMTLIVCSPIIFMQNDIERISPPDWRYFVSNIEKNIPQECYTVYSAGDTYPICMNYRESAMNLAKKSEQNLLMIGFISDKKAQVSCLAENNSEKTLSLGKPFAIYPLSNNYSISIYHLKPLTAANFRKGKPVIAFFVFMPKRQYSAICKQLFLKDDCYVLNAFFNRDYTDNTSGRASRSIPFFIPETSQDFEYYANFSSHALRFFILDSADL